MQGSNDHSDSMLYLFGPMKPLYTGRFRGLVSRFNVYLFGPMKLLYTGRFIGLVSRFNVVSVWLDEASVHR